MSLDRFFLLRGYCEHGFGLSGGTAALFWRLALEPGNQISCHDLQVHALWVLCLHGSQAVPVAGHFAGVLLHAAAGPGSAALVWSENAQWKGFGRKDGLDIV